MKSLLVLVFTTIFSICGFSQNYLKGSAQNYLRRTAYMITQTHKEMIKLDSVNRDGKFSRAVAHQRMARKCYEVNDFKNAVYHSYYARRLTNFVNSTYNPVTPSQFKDTPDEMKMVMTAPTDKVLDDALLKANPGIKFNDNDFLGDAKLYKLDVDDLLQP